MTTQKSLLIISVLLNLLFLSYYLQRLLSRYQKEKDALPHKVWLNRDAYLEKLPVSPSDILLIGDSQIEAFEATEMFHDLRVKNRGINYEKSSTMVERVGREIRGHPAKVFLEGGINDIFDDVSTGIIVKNFKQVIDTISLNSPGTQIFINSLFPSTIKYDVKIKELNKLLQQLCIKNNVVFINNYDDMMFQGRINDLYHIGDSLHLNYEGYKKWMSHLCPYL